MGFLERGHDDRSGGRPEWFDPRPELSSVAHGRLERIARSGVGASTLSAKEFALLGRMGPDPIGEVLGACAYRLGTERLPAEAGYAGEDYSIPLRTINDGWAHARRLAFQRLDDEARTLGADAVLGVRLQRAARGWTRRGIDYSVMGTAVRFPQLPQALELPRPTRPGPDETRRSPVLSDLSVQDYWTLCRAGCEPAGLVAASAVMFVSRGLGTRWRRRRTVLENQELVELSDGFSGARQMAVRDLRDQAKRLGAEGVVGVSFVCEVTEGEFAVDARGGVVDATSSAATTGESIPSAGGGDKRTGMVFTVHVTGTAIRRPPTMDPGEATVTVTMRVNPRSTAPVSQMP